MEKQFNSAVDHACRVLGLQPAGPEHELSLYRHGEVRRTSKVLAIALAAVTFAVVADAIQLQPLVAVAAAIAAYLYQGHRWPERQRPARVAIAVGAAAIALVFPLFVLTSAAAAVALHYQLTHPPRPVSALVALGRFRVEGEPTGSDFAVYGKDLEKLIAEVEAELARRVELEPEAITTDLTPRTPIYADELPARLEVEVAAAGQTLGKAVLVVGRLGSSQGQRDEGSR